MRLVSCVALATVALIVVSGCSQKHTVIGPAPGPRSFAATSPEGAVRRLEWAWSHRDSVMLAEILAGDFQFVFAARDSAGVPVRDLPLDRDAMLCASGRLFDGGGSQPPAQSITLRFDPELDAQPDPRPGKNPRWHREIVTSVGLRIQLEGGSEYVVSGFARYFLVRGDSAAVTGDQLARDVLPDSTRWFVERWNDESWNPGGTRLRPFRPEPAHETTWGMILALYRCD